jgi:hypothetical protein
MEGAHHLGVINYFLIACLANIYRIHIVLYTILIALLYACIIKVLLKKLFWVETCIHTLEAIVLL